MKKLSHLFLIGILSANLTAQNCTEDWNYSQQIRIDNSANPDTLWDYQVLMYINTQDLIGNGKMKANAGDLRFAYDTCCNFICHFIDSGINTQNTKVWVKVPMVPANSIIDLMMLYGNNTATYEQDGFCVFDLFEDYSDYINEQFYAPCDGVLWAVMDYSIGAVKFNWFSNYIVFVSYQQFDMNKAYTAEMWLDSAGGSWPGVFWNKDGNAAGYGLTYQDTAYGIAKSTATDDFCRPEDYVTPLSSNSNGKGLYELTWADDGDIQGKTPNGTSIASNDNTHLKDGHLRLCFGSVKTGTGHMSVDWIRVRKYTPIPPTVIIEQEEISLNSSEDVALCENDVAILDAGGGWSIYSWTTAETTQAITVTSAGAYTVTLSNSLTCQVVNEYNVTEVPLPNAGFTFVNNGLVYDFTAAGSSSYTYAWDFDDSNTSNAQNPSHTYASVGTYNVCLTVTDTNGCSDQSCQQLNVTSIGEYWNTAQLRMYPQPATNLLWIECSALTDASLEIVDLSGRRVYVQTLSNKTGKVSIDISALKAGEYIVRISNKNEITRRLIVKQ